MKKSLLLVTVLSALLLVTVMAVSVSADPSLTIGDVGVVKDAANNLVTFTVPYTATEVEQITILATKGGAETAPAETEENIVYVAQQASATATSFTFSVYLDEFTAETPYCWIKIGGTSIATAQSAGGEKIYETTKVLIYGDVTGDKIINSADTVLVTKFMAATASGAALDEVEFPNGTFPAGADEVADVDGNGYVNSADVVLMSKYMSVIASGGSLEETEFPNGKFPAYSK